MTSLHPRVAIVLVNYNGWHDTIECLESVFRLAYPAFTVIVVDNGSGDDSLSKIRGWAEGQVSAEVSAEHRFAAHLFPPVPKPLPWVELDRHQAESGAPLASASGLALVRAGKNLGFAGACNVGMRLALAAEDTAFVWLLNNDTVVPADALRTLIKRAIGDPTTGFWGSSLLFYHAPDVLQAAGGGILNRWTGTTRGLAAFQPLSSVAEDDATQHLSYISGASMLVSRAVITEIGLMSEDYFLYFEEMDWILRARPRFRFAYVKDSVVYHKEGGSIGTSSTPAQRSALADYYGFRNRIVFTRKFFPYALPTVYLGLLAAAVNRIRRGQFDRLRLIAKAIFSGSHLD